MKKCSGCANRIPEDSYHDVYYGFNVDYGLCNDCLEEALHMCMNPPKFVMTPYGTARLTNDLCIPFVNNTWIVLRCR